MGRDATSTSSTATLPSISLSPSITPSIAHLPDRRHLKCSCLHTHSHLSQYQILCEGESPQSNPPIKQSGQPVHSLDQRIPSAFSGRDTSTGMRRGRMERGRLVSYAVRCSHRNSEKLRTRDDPRGFCCAAPPIPLKLRSSVVIHTHSAVRTGLGRSFSLLGPFRGNPLAF